MILDSSAMKVLFLDVVKRAKGKYDFGIENFCVLGNHFHFIIQPRRGASLSAIMRWIMSVFAMSWNRIHKFSGHVWGERFFSRIIANLREYLQVFLYIDANPVKACQVGDSKDWNYGGLAHIRKGRRDIIDVVPPWLALIVPECRQLCLE